MQFQFDKEKSVTYIEGQQMLVSRTARMVLPQNFIGVGIDPGKNFGIGIVYNGDVFGIWGSLPDRGDDKWENVKDAYRLARKLMERFTVPMPVVIEGPAFGAIYGQPALANIRAALFLGVHSHQSKLSVCSVIPPASARKKVLGDGKKHGKECWVDLNDNAADAVVLAMYAAGVQYNDSD